MGGGGSEKTTTTQDIPPWMRPYAENFMKQSQTVANAPYQAYGGRTVAQLNPYQTAGLDSIAMRGMQGSPINQAAGSELTKTLGGGYLNNNPYMDAMVGQAQGDLIHGYQQSVIPQLDMLDARSGSFGNTGVASARTDAQRTLLGQLGDISTNLRGNDYAAERNRMQGAIGMAPTIANQDYVDANAVLNAGGVYQNQSQANLTDTYNRFLEQRDYPRQQLNILGQGLGMNFGGTQTTNAPSNSNVAGGAMGGALAGAQLGSIFPGIGTGIGAAGGAVLGGLGGK